MKKMTSKQVYDKESRKVKAASFNILNCEEFELFEYANSLNFSVWVKQKLKEEMENRK